MIAISARIQYACLAVMELAKRVGRPRPTRIDEIATEQEIPKQFLVHILLQLKQKGILSSVRGVGGGYSLAQKPETITLGDIVRAVQPTLTTPEAKRGTSHEDAVLLSMWKQVELAAVKELDNVTVAELLHLIEQPVEYTI